MKILYTRIAHILMMLWLCICANNSYAQPLDATYANSQTTGGSGGQVNDASNATNSSETFAEIIASTIIGTTSAWLQLGFASEITSSTGSPATVYVRVNDTSTALLGGGVAVAAYNASGNVVGLIGSGYKTYYTYEGKVFIAITPSANFKSVRITVTSPVAVGSNRLNVYYAFNPKFPSNSSNPYPFNSADCGQPNATTKDYSDLLLASFNITNPSNAIDNQLNTFSSFVSTGAVLTGGHIKQTFLFNGKSNANDAVRVVLSQSGSFAKVNLAASVTLRAYLGSSVVGSSSLINSLLDVALLDLLGTNNTQTTFYFAPKEADGTSVIFDRLELDLNIAGLGIGLGSNGVNVHDIRRVPDVVNASDVTACTNIGTAALFGESLQAGIADIGTFSYAWYSDIRSGTLLSSQQGWTASGLTSAGQTSYYVETIKSGSGCIASPRKKVTVSVLTPPVLPPVVLIP